MDISKAFEVRFARIASAIMTSPRIRLFDLLRAHLCSCDFFSIKSSSTTQALLLHLSRRVSEGSSTSKALELYLRTWERVLSSYNALLHKYFLPAATTLCLKTGLPIFPSVLANGFMIAFSQTSNTSPKNCRMASSVCGLVGLFGMLVLPDDEVPRPAVLVEDGTEV